MNKRIIFIITFLFMISGVVLAQTEKLSLSLSNVTIKECMSAIEKKTDYTFSYDNSINLSSRVSLSVTQEPIQMVLQKLFSGTPISYEFLGRQIVLKGKKTIVQPSGGVSGVVKDVNGDPLLGASVLVKGTSKGTLTNMDGEYTLENIEKNSTLLVSYVGYTSIEVKVDGSVINVVLQEDVKQMNEVVVVGYGVQRKSDLTGAVASMKTSEALKSLPSTNISNTLQGSLAGVSVVSGTGDPSKEMTIRIRGVNSISSDNQPLVVVDGFIGGSLKSLNPSDIQSIEVLKDASATAVYGSLGANGVILVTTKSSNKDKLHITLNTFGSLQTVYKYPDLLSPAEFAELANAYGQEYLPTMPKPQPAKTYYTPEQINSLKNGSAGFDYIHFIFNNPAVSQNYDFSLSGGSEKTSYLASFRYAGNEGIIKKSKNDAFNYRLKLDNIVKSWLKLGFNLYGNYNIATGPRMEAYEGLLLMAINWPTAASPYNADGSQNNTYPIGGLAAYNPVGHIENNNNKRQTVTNNLQTYAEFNIFKGLTFRSQFGVTLEGGLSTDKFNDRSYFYFKNNRTQAYANSNWNISWLNTNILNYVKEFNPDNRINATAVFEQSYHNLFTHQSTSEQLAFNGALGYEALDWADKYYTTSFRTISTLMSEMMRINYVLKNRYMLTASVRADGSSRLEHKWAYFPSFALAWDVAQESFMKEINQISQLKLRAGYGAVGNQAIEPYRIYSKMTPVTNSDGTTSYVVGRPASPDLEWERNEQVNAGMDMVFLKGRLTFTADWYRKVSKQILLDVAQPAHTGWPSLLKNAGEITNTGFEVTVGADPIIKKDFSWNTTLTLTHNKGIYSMIPTITKMQSMGEAGMAKTPIDLFQMIEGEKMGSFYGFICDGVWKTDEVNQAVTVTNSNGVSTTGTYASIYKVVPGQTKLRDINGDGKYDANDKKIIGCGQPSFNWGWNNTLRYKNFDFNVFIIGFHGFDIYNATNQSGYSSSINGVTQDVVTPKRDFLNRWTKNNENSDIPGFVYVPSPVQGFTSNFVEKGDFVKIKNITVGYNLPAKICNVLSLKDLRVYASVQNLGMITGYKGLDPESSLGNPLTSGVDWGNYPNGRNYIFGLNFTF